ncbi:MAG: hypothetical protein KAW12_30745, partial [Candidatus Aminicenantes bacterium]|nr:hypothetical protein [Candidatus Aminicenantes bacterium]
ALPTELRQHKKKYAPQLYVACQFYRDLKLCRGQLYLFFVNLAIAKFKKIYLFKKSSGHHNRRFSPKCSAATLWGTRMSLLPGTPSPLIVYNYGIINYEKNPTLPGMGKSTLQGTAKPFRNGS